MSVQIQVICCKFKVFIFSSVILVPWDEKYFVKNVFNSRLSISDFWFQIQWFQGQIHSQSSPSISLAFFPEPSGEIMTNVNSRYQTLPKKVPLKLLSGLEYLTKVYSGTGWAQELGVGAGGWNIINVFVPWSLEIYIFLIWMSQKCVLVVLIIYLLSFPGKQGPKILHPP